MKFQDDGSYFIGGILLKMNNIPIACAKCGIEMQDDVTVFKTVTHVESDVAALILCGNCVGADQMADPEFNEGFRRWADATFTAEALRQYLIRNHVGDGDEDDQEEDIDDEGMSEGDGVDSSDGIIAGIVSVHD